jgi:magnesium chelatase family protein
MLAKIYSAAVYGVDAYEVEIEVNGAGGDPNIVIVGLPDAAVKESRDRVTTAIANSGYYWPRGRTTINLAPADIKKEGPSFDLPKNWTARHSKISALWASLLWMARCAP